jgi:hypothetical protein
MLELLGVECVPEMALILGVFKVLKSYLDEVQYCTSSLLGLGDECRFWNGRVRYLDGV